MKRVTILYITACLLFAHDGLSQSIDRKQVVERHRVLNTRYDSLSSLSVGNGRFAFTVDMTGLQSFPDAYANGVPLGTQSEWGWHSFRDTAGYSFSETLQDYTFNGKKVPYSVQVNEPGRRKDAVDWFRQNPHRLQLGTIGIVIIKKDGSEASIGDIGSIHQTLNPWTGEIRSRFSVENIPVDVITYCHQQQDLVAVKIVSPLLKQKRLFLRIRFPYPSGAFKETGNGYDNKEEHRSVFIPGRNGGVIRRELDDYRYYLRMQWEKEAGLTERQEHDFIIRPGAETFSASFCFSETDVPGVVPSFDQVASGSRQVWKTFWQSGAALDLSGNTDPRAHELERRIVLSQYLTRIQCTGNYPPQETGLTYNSWYGKFHLEMHWWHAVHFALWGRVSLLEKQLSWYSRAYPAAKALAARQGYEGIRWQKMTDNTGRETSSSIGSFLLWQQPHFIYLAELVYREYKHDSILRRYGDLVFATADFMSSFPYYDTAAKRYILGKGVMPAQERYLPAETFNPTYELAYWYWALDMAQQWRQRMKLARKPEWDTVLAKLSPLPVQQGKYLFAGSATDSYTRPSYRTDHPSVLGTLGMLPVSKLTDTVVMHRTFDWIWQNWSWNETWGWDFPMTAMTATRLGLPAKAVDALLMAVPTNTYLRNGHNYQDQRLTIYLPGNGGLLAAIAMMCAGYDGNIVANPGIPPHWKIKHEGFRKMP